MRIVEDDRVVIGWMNYKRKGTVDPARPMGPNTLREWLWPVEVEDKGKRGMRVGFSLVNPPELS